MRAERIVESYSAHAEITHCLHPGGDRIDHGVCPGPAETLVVCKEKGFVADNRTAERAAEIILDQEFRAHIVECIGVERSVAQKLVSCPVKLIASRPSDDVDLATPCTSHLGRVTTGLNFEFLDGVGRRAEVEGIEGWIGIRRSIKQEVIGIGAVSTDADG